MVESLSNRYLEALELGVFGQTTSKVNSVFGILKIGD